MSRAPKDPSSTKSGRPLEEEPGRMKIHQVISGERAQGFNFGSFSGTFQANPEAVSLPAARPAMDPPLRSVRRDPARILFLASNPEETNRLRLDEEARALLELLDHGPSSGSFELLQQWAVRITDLLPLLLRHRPHILHFSGHGLGEAGVLLEGEGGGSVAISGRQLAQLLGHFSETLRCVFLNACFSLQQATEVSEAIDCVVGVSGILEDRLAIQVAASFYRALASGCSVQRAFDLMRADPAMGPTLDPECLHLLARRGKANSTFFDER